MSREFRSWDKALHRWAKTTIYLREDGVAYKDTDPSGVDMSGSVRIGPGAGRYEVTFSTGLKDITGKEIFEGDILTDIKKEDFRGRPLPVRRYKVIFRHGSFRAKGINYQNNRVLNPWYIKEHNLQVTGNIYEDGDI